MATWCESYYFSRTKLDKFLFWYDQQGFTFALRLFKANTPSTPDKTFADFDWCDFPGSDDQFVNPAVFGPAVTGPDGVSTVTSANLYTFTNGGAAQDVWGYVFLDPESAYEYMGGETFSGALALQPGASITIQPRFKQRSAQF